MDQYIDMCWSWENQERVLSRRYGVRVLEWDEEDGHTPTKLGGPQPNIPLWLFLVTDYWPSQAWWWLKGLYCRRYGHDMVDTGHGGPDNGWDSGHCLRCGWDYHHTYY